MMKRLVLCLAAAGLIAPAAVAEDVYTCKVTDMITAPDVGHDMNFVEANKRKTFTFIDRGNTLQVDVASQDYTPSSDNYDVINRSSYEIWAQKPGSIAMDTVMISTIANREGVYRATVVSQYTLFVNSWHLDCSKKKAPPRPRDPNKPDWQN